MQITPEQFGGATGNGITDDTEAVQNALDVWVNSNSNCPLVLTGDYRITAPLVVKPTKNIIRTKTIRFEGGALIDALDIVKGEPLLTFTTRGTGYLWRNLHIQDAQFIASALTGASAQMVLDGGLEARNGGYEALYSFDIVGTVITGAKHHGIVIKGDTFEGQITGGRIESNNLEGNGIHILSGPDDNTSSLYLDKFSVYGFETGIWNDCPDVRCTNLTVLHNKREGIQYTNNIGGTVQNCHFENNWLCGETGAGIHMGNVIRVTNNFALNSEGGQKYVIDAYSDQPNNVIIGGFNMTGTDIHANLKGSGTYKLIGVESYDATPSVIIDETLATPTPVIIPPPCQPQFKTRRELLRFLFTGK